MAGQMLRLLSLGDVVVGLHDRRGLPLPVPLQRPPARDGDPRRVAFGMDEFAFPTAGAEQLGVDLLDRRGKDCLRQLVTDLADRLLRRPSVQFLGAAIPVGDDVVHAVHENRIVREIEEAGLVAQPRLRRLALHGEIGRNRDRRDAGEQVHDALGSRDAGTR